MSELTYTLYNKTKIALRGDREKYQKIIKSEFKDSRWNPRMKGGEGWLIPIEDEEKLKLFLSKINGFKDDVLNEIEEVKRNTNVVEEMTTTTSKYKRGHDDSDSESDSDNNTVPKADNIKDNIIKMSGLSSSSGNTCEDATVLETTTIKEDDKKLVVDDELIVTPPTKKKSNHQPPPLRQKERLKESKEKMNKDVQKRDKHYDKEIKESVVKSRVELTKEKIARLEAKEKVSKEESSNLNKKKRPSSDSSRSTPVENFYKNFSKNPVEFKKKHKNYSRPSISSSSESSDDLEGYSDDDVNNNEYDSDDDYPLAETPKPKGKKNSSDREIQFLKKEMLELQKKVDLIELTSKRKR